MGFNTPDNDKPVNLNDRRVPILHSQAEVPIMLQHPHNFQEALAARMHIQAIGKDMLRLTAAENSVDISPEQQVEIRATAEYLSGIVAEIDRYVLEQVVKWIHTLPQEEEGKSEPAGNTAVPPE